METQIRRNERCITNLPKIIFIKTLQVIQYSCIEKVDMSVQQMESTKYKGKYAFSRICRSSAYHCIIYQKNKNTKGGPKTNYQHRKVPYQLYAKISESVRLNCWMLEKS